MFVLFYHLTFLHQLIYINFMKINVMDFLFSIIQNKE